MRKQSKKSPGSLGYVLYKHKTQEMCNGALEEEHLLLEFVPKHLKNKEMDNKAVHEDPHYPLEFVPKHFKTQQMCNEKLEMIPDVCSSLLCIARGDVVWKLVTYQLLSLLLLLLLLRLCLFSDKSKIFYIT